MFIVHFIDILDACAGDCFCISIFVKASITVQTWNQIFVQKAYQCFIASQLKKRKEYQPVVYCQPVHFVYQPVFFAKASFVASRWYYFRLSVLIVTTSNQIFAQTVYFVQGRRRFCHCFIFREDLRQISKWRPPKFQKPAKVQLARKKALLTAIKRVQILWTSWIYWPL